MTASIETTAPIEDMEFANEPDRLHRESPSPASPDRADEALALTPFGQAILETLNALYDTEPLR